MTNYTGSTPSHPRKPDWRDNATCASLDPEIWFPQPGDTAAVHEAKQHCFGCPVMTDCARYALQTRQMTGVWGGLSEQQRNTLLKRRTPNPDTVSAVVHQILREELNPITSLRELWEDRTYPLPGKGGHIGWRADNESSYFNFQGHRYTPRRLAFLLDRGHKPVGIVRRTPECPVIECVNPRHVADGKERFDRKQAEQRAALAALEAAAAEPVEALAS